MRKYRDNAELINPEKPYPCAVCEEPTIIFHMNHNAFLCVECFDKASAEKRMRLDRHVIN